MNIEKPRDITSAMIVLDWLECHSDMLKFLKIRAIDVVKLIRMLIQNIENIDSIEIVYDKTTKTFLAEIKNK